MPDKHAAVAKRRFKRWSQLLQYVISENEKCESGLQGAGSKKDGGMGRGRGGRKCFKEGSGGVKGQRSSEEEGKGDCDGSYVASSCGSGCDDDDDDDDDCSGSSCDEASLVGQKRAPSRSSRLSACDPSCELRKSTFKPGPRTLNGRSGRYFADARYVVRLCARVRACWWCWSFQCV